ncbi:PfkB-family carbohydrate kinase [Streptomyces hygroscopicus subsp. jinggangensis 5008]|nr:PfkB-family carbohydrate kinase [Streptomyces hygroscopicus subsp. jinggangensis 5008]
MSALWHPRPGPVVCVGETMAALVPDGSDSLEAARRMRLSVAGAESNVAMYLADLGIPVSWLSALGDDALGRRVRAEIAASGADVSAVRQDPKRPTGLLIKEPSGDRTRVRYYRTGSAASALGPGVLHDPRVKAASMVHLTGITAALSPSCRRLVERALAPSGQRPYSVSFDVNHRPALWPGGTAGRVLRELANRADVTFVGLDEAQELWDMSLRPADLRDLLPGPRLLVVKDGGRASTVFAGKDVWSVPAPHVDVVEPVGAGDAFAAGFLAGLLRGADMPRALRLGHITAASALRVTGDHGPLPDAGSIERLLALSDTEWRAHGRGEG